MTTPTHTQALSLCTYCPKLCRFSCPVSEATSKETLTPWGKMSSLKRVEESPSSAPFSAKQTAYACTGCGHCQEYCKHHVDVEASLFPARRGLLESQEAPEAVQAEVKDFARRAPALSEALRDWRKTGLSSFHPGCSVLAQPSVLEDARAVLEAIAPGEMAAASQGEPPCCGYPLYAAGAIKEFQAHALVSRLRFPRGRLLVADPGCAYTFQVLYPRYGAPLDAVVETLPTFIEGRLPKTPKVVVPPVQYHDACYLGRRLQVYEAPRKVLAWATGEAPAELPFSQKDAPCSGAGGLLPKSLPGVAQRIAEETALLAEENEGKTLVTACASAKKMLSTTKASTAHWITVVRKALDV